MPILDYLNSMEQPAQADTESAPLEKKSASKKSMKSDASLPKEVKDTEIKPSQIDESKDDRSEIPKADEKEDKVKDLPPSVKNSRLSDKSPRKSSLKSIQSSKLSQKQKEDQVVQIKSEMRNKIIASGKPLKTGKHEAESNVKEFSAQNAAKSDIPAASHKKVTTESKKTKAPATGTKSKTEIKEVKDEKTPIIQGVRKSARRVKKEDVVKEDKDTNLKQSRSNSRKKSEEKVEGELGSSPKRTQPAKSSEKRKSESTGRSKRVKSRSNTPKSSSRKKEEPKKSERKSALKKKSSSKHSIKDSIKSGVKKVKLDSSVKLRSQSKSKSKV